MKNESAPSSRSSLNLILFLFVLCGAGWLAYDGHQQKTARDAAVQARAEAFVSLQSNAAGGRYDEALLAVEIFLETEDPWSEGDARNSVVREARREILQKKMTQAAADGNVSIVEAVLERLGSI